MAAPELIERDVWGARPPERSLTPMPDANVLTAHWNGSTPPTDPATSSAYTPGNLASEVRAVQRIQRLHQSVGEFAGGPRNWRDIAYSFLISMSGRVFVGRGWGFKTAANGTGNNDHAHAAMFMIGGNWTLTPQAIWAWHHLVETAPVTASLPDPPGAQQLPSGLWVNGHKDWKSTQCPGPEVYSWLKAQPWEDYMALRPEVEAWLEARYDANQDAKGPNGEDAPVTPTTEKHITEVLRRIADGVGMDLVDEAQWEPFGEDLAELLAAWKAGALGGAHTHEPGDVPHVHSVAGPATVDLTTGSPAIG